MRDCVYLCMYLIHNNKYGENKFSVLKKKQDQNGIQWVKWAQKAQID